MRTLFILRGCPSCGKSTWIENNFLKPITISSDDIRLLYGSLDTNLEGKPCISSVNDKRTWNFIKELVAHRMAKGDTFIIDATHTTNKSLKMYQDLIEKYKYRAYVVDFMNDISLTECLERNTQRPLYKQVPAEVIKRMYDNCMNAETPNKRFTVITPAEALELLTKTSIYDFNKWNNIHIFGDIHGCYAPLKEWFDKNGFSDNDFYLFAGDYIDRGPANAEVIAFLSYLHTTASNSTKNVMFLVGNHDVKLQKYLDGEEVRSKEFNENTVPQIKTLSRTTIHNVSDHLAQMAYFNYKDKVYFVSHGGLSTVPTATTSLSSLISGTGSYGDLNKVYDSWIATTPTNHIMVHGHRNLTNYPIEVVKDKIYNLCDEIEYGGYLRVMNIHADNTITTDMIKNNEFNKEKDIKGSIESPFASSDEFIQALNESTLIQKKCLADGVVSYNFTRDAFFDSKWNALTIKARGLFIDSVTNKIVARAYDKFFARNECELTTDEALLKNMQGKITVYLKENGFLGLVSYDKRNDRLFIASKSTTGGPFAGYAKEWWLKQPELTRDQLTSFLKANDVTLVFEVVDQERDPHIIEYAPENCGLYLLDMIDNTFNFNKLPYQELVEFAKLYDLRVKKQLCEFNTVKEALHFLDENDAAKTFKEEGFVLESENGFMLKYKAPFYKFWKNIRSLRDRIVKGKEINRSLLSKETCEVVDYMYSLNMTENLSIPEIRNGFLNRIKEK